MHSASKRIVSSGGFYTQTFAFFPPFSLSYLLSSVTSPLPFHLWQRAWTQEQSGMSDASVAMCAASAARHGVGGVVQLGRGESGGRGGGGESTGFTGQSQLPQGVQGIHLSSS